MKTSIGTFLSIGSPAIAELAALSGFDWALIDLEHGCGAEAAVPDQLRAFYGKRTQGIVRVGAAHSDLIARLLDWGADGIMVPHVNSAAEAEAIVKAAWYPPRGHRGYSRSVRAHDFGFRPTAERPAPILMAQIETIESLHHVEEVASVEGINVLFVGPADLQLDLQCAGDTAPWSYAECLERVVAAARAAGKEPGIMVRDLAEAPHFIALGFTRIAIDSDLSVLRKTWQQTIGQLKQRA